MSKEIDVHEEFATDLMSAAPLSIEEARKLGSFLESEGFVDYDTLKEIYLYGEDE